MSSEAGEVAIDDHMRIIIVIMISIMMVMTMVVILMMMIQHANFITCEHYHYQADPGLSYSDLGCRSQPLDTAVIMEQSAGCGPDGVGLSPSEDTPKCSREQQTKSL